MHKDIPMLTEVQRRILLELRRHRYRCVSELIRSMGLGGTTFQTHVSGLRNMKMVMPKIEQMSKIRVVEYDLTVRGRIAADLLNQVSLVITEIN